MQLSLAELLRLWHDFYTLMGAASATLVGLIFVAISIGAGSFSSERGKVAMRSFLSPTVLHFSAVLFICLLATIPTETWDSLGVLLCIVGLIGAAYSIWNSRRMSKYGITASIDLIDRLWYARLPILIYLLIVAVGASLTLRIDAALNALAIALILLLLAGIRNAWDMSVWIIQHREQ
jgi:hypothetical protein